MDDYLNALIGAGPVLTGNTGKLRVLVELARRIDRQPGLRILDIGCAGPNPLDFWRPLFALYPDRFHLTGIDPDRAGIERARAQFSYPWLTLLHGSGYDLDRLFAGQSFDIIVFTQVLEHVFHYREFLQQVARACSPGADVLFTLDSGHYPHRRLKDSLKGLLVRLGREAHYEHGWRVDQLDAALAGVGLAVVERGFYCLPGSKRLHNHALPDAHKNEFLRHWYTHEALANAHAVLDEQARRQFLILFYHARRVT